MQFYDYEIENHFKYLIVIAEYKKQVAKEELQEKMIEQNRRLYKILLKSSKKMKFNNPHLKMRRY